MAHRRGGFRGRSVPESLRRKKTWQSFASISTPNVAGLGVIVPDIGTGPDASVGLQLQSSINAASIGLLEGTLLRIRGSLIVPKSSLTGDPATTEVFAFGIGFVTDEAAAAVAVPNPATPAGADWDGWLFYRSNVAAPLDANAAAMDSKAMRKWNSGMSLVLVAGQANDIGSAPIAGTVIQTVLRGLFLLP